MGKRYDVNKSFEENKQKGPYEFDDIENNNLEINSLLEDYGIETDFFGYKTKLPIGVAAGPLFNIKYMKAAAMDGFNLITWKTFRSVFRLAHRNNGDFLGHNIVFINQDTQFRVNSVGSKIKGYLNFDGEKDKISITNSFGMGSDTPNVWTEEIRKIEPWMKKNNKQTIASVVGSPEEGWSVYDLAEDYAKTAKYAQEAGSEIIELNFSCPNVSGEEGSIYKSSEDSEIILKKVKEVLREDTKLLIKIGYSTKEEYRELILAVKEYIDGVVAINTVPMQVVDDEEKQALPGGITSGVCGYAILDMAVDAVKSLVELREELYLDFKVVGCGGVTNPQAAMRHIEVGADFVMVGTAAIFNPELPLDFARYINENKINMIIGRKKILY